MTAMSAMAKTGVTMSQGRGFVCGFGFIATSEEDARAAQAFASALLKNLGQAAENGSPDHSNIIDGACSPVPPNKKLPHRTG